MNQKILLTLSIFSSTNRGVIEFVRSSRHGEPFCCLDNSDDDAIILRLNMGELSAEQHNLRPLRSFNRQLLLTLFVVILFSLASRARCNSSKCVALSNVLSRAVRVVSKSSISLVLLCVNSCRIVVAFVVETCSLIGSVNK